MDYETMPYVFEGEDGYVDVDTPSGLCSFPAEAGARLLLTAPDDEQMLVACHLLDGEVWALAPTLGPEGTEWPGWDVLVEHGSEESPRLVVHAPVGTTVMSV